MPEPDLIELFAEPLNRIGVRYLISGSVAAMLYGEPRVTHDIDMIVFLRLEDIPRLNQAFPEPEFYLPPVEVIAAEMARDQRGHFNVICPDWALKADIYLAKGDDFHAWAFRHAKKYLSNEMPIPLAPPEYVIVRKLEYFKEGGSEKHLRDIRAMLKVSAEQLDQAELKNWISRRGVEDQWKLVKD